MSEEERLYYKAAHSKSSRSEYMLHKAPFCEHSSLGIAGLSTAGAEEWADN